MCCARLLYYVIPGDPASDRTAAISANTFASPSRGMLAGLVLVCLVFVFGVGGWRLRRLAVGGCVTTQTVRFK